MNDMRHHITARTARASALALALGLACALSSAAQTPGERHANPGTQSTLVSPGAPGAIGMTTDRTATTTGTTGTTLSDAERTPYRDRDRDWSWLGLLGLVGLAGLLGKRDVRDGRELDRDGGRTTPTTR